LDDAYQHRSVKAGVNVLITDHSKPFYTDRILPLGSLRESRSAYKRADVIIVSKCPRDMNRAMADEIIAKINPLPHQKVFFTAISYRQPYDFMTGEPVSLRGKSAVLVCCIAKPAPLVRYLQDELKQVHVLSYPDHHYFVSHDLEEIKEAHGNFEAADKIIVTTEKDAARLHLHYEKLKEWNVPIVVLPIGVSFLFNQGNEFDTVVLQYVEQTLAENNQMFHGNQEII
jgi:tetraacyldisaccharide 4'-kinase